MIEINYEPIKKITLHDIQKYSLADFIEIHGNDGMLGWSNGLIYSVGHFHQTVEIVKDKLQGIEHWQVVDFAIMEKFVERVVTKSNIELSIVNQSNHPKIAEIINFVKENHNE